MSPEPTLNEVLTDLHGYLAYQRSQPDADVRVRPEVLATLSAPPPTRPEAPRTAGAGQPGPATTTGLSEIATRVAACTRCRLHQTRTRTVPGQGAPAPEIMFIGEGPGGEEDRQGLAFVGRAGQLLTRMIQAMGYSRDEVFIGNIVKCRPPGNRQPLPDEMESCLPFLREQIKHLKPKVIVTLGATAAKGLLGVETGITRLRGTWCNFEDIPVMPTFHPAYLLRTPKAKHEAWADLQAVLKHLGRTPPPVKKTAAS